MSSLFLLFCCAALPASLQSPLETFAGPGAGAHFGSVVRDAGDIDADGMRDMLVNAPYATPAPGMEEAGWCGVISGRTRAVLLEWWGSAPGQRFGSTVAPAGDVNNDGRPDIVVQVPGTGRLEVYSGVDGSLVQSFQAVNANQTGGAQVDGLGDWNGDGYGDVVAGYPSAKWGTGSMQFSQVGIVEVYSGKDGSLLRFWTGDMIENFGLGYRVVGLGDADGNGFGDFAVAANASTAEKVRVYGGPNSVPLAQFQSQSTGGSSVFGADIAAAGDMNGDGIGDLWIGAPAHYDPQQQDWVGAVHLVSATGASLATVFGSEPWAWFGTRVAGGSDVDLDGVPDLLVQSSGATELVLISGADGTRLFEFAPGDLSNSAAGPIEFIGDWDRNGGGELAIAFPDPIGTVGGAGGVVVVAGCNGRWNPYGHGLAGTGGHTPELRGARCPLPGAPVELRIDGGLGGAVGFLLVGVTKAKESLLGGTQLVANPLVLPHLLVGAPQGAGAGAAILPFFLPMDPALSGVELQLQSLYLDAGAPGGLSMSGGLTMSIG